VCGWDRKTDDRRNANAGIFTVKDINLRREEGKRVLSLCGCVTISRLIGVE